jgi:hypothetical protein
MSDFTTNDQTGSELFATYDLSKIFLFNNEFEDAPVGNATGSAITYLPGTVMGRISATGLIIPAASAANDGSQFPIGILNRGIVLQPSDSRTVSICISGEVAGEMLILAGSDTLDTVVTNANGRRMRDVIVANSAGIIIKFSENLTFGDNV